MSIAVIVPTYGRPGALQRLTDNIQQATRTPHTIIFVAEHTDAESIAAATATGQMVVVHDGEPSYSNAFQAGYEQSTDEFFVNGNDDFHFQPGWDVAALAAMTDDVNIVGINDGYHGTDAIMLVRRSYIEEQSGVVDISNRVFYPYKHNFVDTELRETAQARGCYRACPESVIRHAHPDFDAGLMDATYEKSKSQMGTDAQTFHERRKLWANLSTTPKPIDDVTVIIPFWRKNGRRDWLQECISGFPMGIKYMVVENDGDLADALNEALELVETTWVMRFDHDDIPGEGMLEQMLSVSEDADVLYPTMFLTDEELKPLGPFNADVFCGNRLQQWNFVSGGFLGRTEMVRKAGGWRELDLLEDWDLHVRMHRAGARFKAVPSAQFAYRQVEGSRNKTEHEKFPSAKEYRAHYREQIVGTPTPAPEATFYFQSTPAVAYWRCVLPARALPGVATSDLSAIRDADGGMDFLDHRGAAVFQFPANNERAIALLKMQEQGTRYLVEVDDNYLDEQDELWRGRAGWTKTIGQSKAEWRSKPHSVEGHRWITERADGVIVTTPTLAKIYGEVNDNVYVCRNSVDPSDWPELKKPDDGVFRIGWFASRSHDRDADLVRKAMSWASRQPGVEVWNIGLDPAGWNFDRVQVGWSEDFTAYRKWLMQLDVGMAPVLATSSSVCRSDLKVLEYAMAGAMTIAQRLAPYEEWFDGPALVATTAKEYADHVRWCVRNQDEARAMGRKARELVLNTRTITAEIPKWREAVNG